jgi:hypothetical protein
MAETTLTSSISEQTENKVDSASSDYKLNPYSLPKSFLFPDITHDTVGDKNKQETHTYKSDYYNKNINDYEQSHFMLIMRTHHGEYILNSLERFIENINSNMVETYLNMFFKEIKKLKDDSPNDEFLEILYAIYDAMSYNNSWEKYDEKQYQRLYALLKIVVNETNLTNDKISKFIQKIESFGFATLPFEIFDISEDKNEDDI